MDPKYVMYFAVALIVAGLLINVGLWWMLRQLEREQERREAPPTMIQVPKEPPEPRLQINPQGDLKELRRQEDEILSTYAWIDREKGTARIPIDRAIELFPNRQKK